MKREWDSGAYDRLSDPQFGWGLKVLQKLQALPLSSPGNGHFLDAGCGTGRVTAELLKAFPQSQVTAVDASANMVEEAGKRLAAFGQRVKVAQVDLLELSDENSFDVVLSTAVFHWIHDHDKLFQVLFRALRPGGILLAQCGGGPNLARIHGRAEQLMKLPEFAPYFKDWKRFWEYPGAEITAERLQHAGFLDVSTGLEPAPTQLPDETTFRSFTATVNMHPYLKRLPPELHDSFIGALAKQAAQDDPPFVLDYWRLNMYGRRA
jgi:trans-aconitate 2-methyltransferase